MWNWVADHTTEDFAGGSSIAAKGGALVEATKGTWLHALGSEHYWLYQLNLRGARNVFVSLLQSETNYEQGDHAESVAPAPWQADVQGWGDPDYSWCDGGDTRCRMGFSNYIQVRINYFNLHGREAMSVPYYFTSLTPYLVLGLMGAVVS